MVLEDFKFVAPISHCTDGFDLFQMATKWNPVQMPLSWNLRTKSFESVAVLSKSYFTWCLCIWGVLGFLVTTTSLHAILNVESSGMASAVICSGWIGISTLIWSSATVTCMHWKTIIRGFKGYNELTEILDIRQPQAGKSFQSDKNWITIGKILKGIIGALLGIPLVLLPCGIIQEMDPFVFPFRAIAHWVCEYEKNCSLYAEWLVLVLRCGFGYIALFEGCRFCAIFFPTILYLFERQMHCLYVLGLFHQRLDSIYGLVHFRWYTTLKVADRLCNEAFCWVMCVAIGSGFTLWVGVNVISLKCYNILPLSVYWLMPTISVVILILAAVVLSTVVKIRDNSKSQLFRVKVLLTSKVQLSRMMSSKLITRKLRSLKPISMKCGQLFPLTQDSKVRFFYDVVLRTVDGCMLPIFQ